MLEERGALPIAHVAIHDTVVAMLKDLPRGPLLDVPTGEGALAQVLQTAGFDVRCCDLYPEIFRLPNVEIRRGDMTDRLPYSDQSFQYITCLEGLEHTENPAKAVGEFARLLKPGGHLIVSVPNVLNIEERFKGLLDGYTSHFKPLSREHIESVRGKYVNMEEIGLHVHAIPYTELRYYLEKHGFRLIRTYRDKPKTRLWLYLPAVVILRTIARFRSAQKRRERWTDELNSDEVLMGGNTLIVHAIKTGSPTP